ncbi:MAG TPA: MFS transporter [Streptosporangiaceae bacterium]|nr:MFS transporter [Streptosporangiaceae bacterium]
MSTLTHAEPGRATAGRPEGRIISGPLALVFLSSFGTLTGFYLLLSVTPRYAAAAGAGSTGAGLVTGALLLGTVAAELAATTAMRRYGYRTLLAVGAVLLGAPTLVLLSGGPLAIIVTVSVVRGLGFGLSGVVASALTVRLLPPARRGEGLGLDGVVDGVPAVVALPAGLWLAGHCGTVVVVAIAAAAALAPLAALPWLPGVTERRTAQARGEAGAPAGLLASLRNGGQRRPSLIFAASTVAAGVVVSFLPLAAGVSANTAAAGLLAQALTATVSRWWAGRHGDRHGHARLLVPGLVIATLGMTAMIWLTSPAALIAGMCLFGTGFGILQNATLVLMADRMPASGLGTASALWNLAYDAGYGAGPAVFGLFAGHTGYPAAFALTGVLMVAALPAAWPEHSHAASAGYRASTT